MNGHAKFWMNHGSQLIELSIGRITVEVIFSGWATLDKNDIGKCIVCALILERYDFHDLLDKCCLGEIKLWSLVSKITFDLNTKVGKEFSLVLQNKGSLKRCSKVVNVGFLGTYDLTIANINKDKCCSLNKKAQFNMGLFKATFGEVFFKVLVPFEASDLQAIKVFQEPEGTFC